jgi:hypothetical protein
VLPAKLASKVVRMTKHHHHTTTFMFYIFEEIKFGFGGEERQGGVFVSLTSSLC